ncbi:hypothetical protein QUC31_017912 [Theobroma cacao]
MFDIKRARKLESCESRISNENNVMDSQLATEILIQRHENSRSSKRWRMGFYKAGDGYGNIYESNSMEIVSKIITDAKVSTYLGERQVHDSKLPIQSVIFEGSIVGEQKKEIYDQEESWTACAMSSIGTMAGKPHDKFSPSMFLSDPSKKSSRLENCNQDYYTFDNTRNAALYSVGQVWAIYNEEGMPRRYAQIICIDEFPFRLHVSWFNLFQLQPMRENGMN